MTHLEQAIRDAVEKGGYKVQNLRLNGSVLYHDAFTSVGGEKPAAMVLLDPAFWQALGRARGNWGKKNHDPVWKVTYNIEEHTVVETWANVMLDFTYHIAADKDVESFFATLV